MSVRIILASAVFVALAASCTYEGGGKGVLMGPAASATAGGERKGAATFKWTFRGQGTEGDISARLPDGRTYRGTFLQMTAETRYDTAWPYWRAWQSSWWGPWGPGGYGYYGPSTQHATTYLGKVVAHLEGSDGSLMRCRFLLRRPMRGIRGGGTGECQISTQEQVLAVDLERAG